MAAHVLVVDDDPAVCESTCSILESAGYETTPAHDGLEALEIVRSSPDIDAVILDLFMPRLDGLGVLDTMPDGPVVIVVSAFAHRSLAEVRAQYWGKVCAFLQKPVRPPALIQTVEHCLNTVT